MLEREVMKAWASTWHSIHETGQDEGSMTLRECLKRSTTYRAKAAPSMVRETTWRIFALGDMGTWN